MPRRKKLDKTKRVKAMARERVGIPKPSRIMSTSQERPEPKHKRSLVEEGAES